MTRETVAYLQRGEANVSRPAWLRYGVGVAAVIVATLLKLLLRNMIGDASPFLLYFGALTVTAFYGGVGPGLLATLVGATLAAFFFEPPKDTIAITGDGVLRALIFLAEGTLVSALAGAWRQALAHVEQARVQESTARQAAERAEQDMLAVVESIGDPFAVIDDDWRIVYANEAAARFVGSEHGAWRGRRLPDAFPNLPADAPWMGTIAEALRQRVSASVESFAPLRGRWYALRVYPSTIGVALYLRDVTTQRQLEETARQSEQRYRALVERSADGIILLNADAQLMYVSPSAERIFGYTVEQLTTPGFFMAKLHRHDLAALGAAWPALRQGEQVTLEVRILRPDGGWRWVEAAGSNLVEEPAVGAMVINVRDISERKEAERERMALLEREQSARRAAEDARAVTAFLADAGEALGGSLDYEATLARVAELAVPFLADLCTMDLAQGDGTYQRVAVAGTPALRAVAQQLQRYPPTPRLPGTVPRALRTGETELIRELPPGLLDSATYDAVHRALVQQVQAHSLLLVPLKARGETVGVLGFAAGAERPAYGEREVAIAEDLARRAALALDNARLYREAQRALSEATEALAVRERFLSIASHELRTPLTSLRGQLQLGMRRLARGAPEEDVRVSIEIAHHQVNRITRLVNDLLDVSRLGAGTFALDREPLAIAPFVERLVREERQLDPTRPIALTLPTDSQPQVLADGSRLEQVLTNLLQNARKYSPADAPIAVDVAADGENVAIAVRDQGIGIPPEDRERIFAAFQRAGNIDTNTPGLGLGLYIARELVHAHGGAIALASTPGAGSTFTVSLPLLTAEPEHQSTFAPGATAG